ncbi:MBL fold metallo-hydrolase [Chloroflexota bacterium]
MVTEILPNIYCIEVPLPGSPLKSVNSYLIKAPERFLIIDTGWKREECRRALLPALRNLNVDLTRTDFFITHMHDDHIGLVAELATDKSNVYFNAPEASIVSLSIEAAEERWEKINSLYESHSFPQEDFGKGKPWNPRQLYRLGRRVSFHILKEADVLDVGDYSFHCIETPGHSPGHICLYEPRQKILVSGDHILDTITPNICYWPELENPLKEFLASLEKLRQLEVNAVLPAHRNIVYDLTGRISELKEHHANRLNQIMVSLDSNQKNAYQVARNMKWDIDYPSWELFPPTQKWFAMGETIAHLKYLESQYKIRRKINKQDIMFSVAF